jgi:phage shock protein A
MHTAPGRRTWAGLVADRGVRYAFARMPATPRPHASLVRAAAAEDQRLERALARLTRRRETLAAELAELEAQMDELRERQRLLDMLVDGADRDELATRSAAGTGGLTTPLRGRRLRLIAAQLLWQRLGTQEIYYREWFEQLVQAGYAVGGRDPLASFLTNVRDSPAVVRGQTQGYYRLDPTRVDAVARDLAEAEAELADLEQSLQRARTDHDATAIERLREHRSKLAAAIRRREAHRDELAAVFNDDADHEPQRAPAQVQAA